MFVLKCSIILVILYLANGENDLSIINQLENNFLWTRSPKILGEEIKYSLTQPESRFISKRCFVDLLKYANGLIHLKLWAIKIFDATGKIPAGLLRGYGSNLGSFDECISANSKQPNPINGKYCLGHWTVAKFENDLEILNEMKTTRQINPVNGTFSLTWAVCVPDSCSAKDLNFVHFLLRLKFTEETCQTQVEQNTDYDTLDKIAIGIFVAFTIIILAFTTYHVIHSFVQKGNPSLPSKIINSFSLLTNISEIVTNEDEAHMVSCLHGIRVISLVFIMGGLRFVITVLGPILNWIDVLDWILNKDLSAVIDAIIFGDTFIVVSGFLVAYNYLTLKAEGGKFNLIVYYLKRIIRILPALTIIILLHTSLMRHLGSGPVWPECRDTYLVTKCREYWWSSLLFIQNYMNPGFTDVCILQTWQLSLDMQLFILSPLILFPLTKHPKYTISFVIFLIIASITSSFLTAWVYELKAVFRNTSSLNDLNSYFTHFYFPIHTRASPWLIGFLTGYFGFAFSKRNYSKRNIEYFGAGLLWILSVLVLIFCIMIGRYMMGQKYDWVTNSFHIALIRPFWAIAVCWIIFACMNGYLEFVNKVLSSGVFRSLSKITYSTYLVNLSLMFLMTCQTRQPIEFGVWSVISILFTDIIACLSFGFLWAVMFEYPFRGIVKALLDGTKYIIPQRRKKDQEEL